MILLGTSYSISYSPIIYFIFLSSYSYVTSYSYTIRTSITILPASNNSSVSYSNLLEVFFFVTDKRNFYIFLSYLVTNENYVQRYILGIYTGIDTKLGIDTGIYTSNYTGNDTGNGNGIYSVWRVFWLSSAPFYMTLNLRVSFNHRDDPNHLLLPRVRKRKKENDGNGIVLKRTSNRYAPL